VAPNRRLSGFFNGKMALIGHMACFIQYTVLFIRSVLWASNVPKNMDPAGRAQVLRTTTKKRSLTSFENKSAPSQVHLLPHLSPFYFSLSFIGFTYFLLLSIPSLSTRIVPLRFQEFVFYLCYLYSLV